MWLTSLLAADTFKNQHLHTSTTAASYILKQDTLESKSIFINLVEKKTEKQKEDFFFPESNINI